MKGFPSPLRMETDPPKKGVKTNSSENGFKRVGKKVTGVDPYLRPNRAASGNFGVGEEENTTVEGRYSEHSETGDGVGFQVREMDGVTGTNYYLVFDKGGGEKMKQNQISENPSNVDRRSNRDLEKGSYSPKRLLEHERATAAQNAMIKLGQGFKFDVYMDQYRSDAALLKQFNSLPDSYDGIKQAAMMEATKNFQEELARRRAEEL